MVVLREVPLAKEAEEKEAAYKKQMKIEYGMADSTDDQMDDELTGDELKKKKTGK